MISITDLLKSTTGDQAFEGFLANLQSLKIPARSWRKGGAYRAILRVVANMYAGFSEVLADFVAYGFLETATGGWLRLLALGLFGVEFIEATFATGFVTLHNEGGGIYPYGPGEVTVKNTTSGKIYVLTDAINLNPGDTVTVGVRAVEIGSASTAAPGEIDDFETQLRGVTITNAEAVVGNDDEDDDSLRQRCRDKRGALSPRGARGAYADAIRGARRLDGSAVNINRVQISPFSSTGTVYAYAASPSGAPTTEDLDAARAAVEAKARPDTVTFTLAAAVEVPVARTITIWAKRADGVVAADIKAAAEAALITRIANYPVGGIAKPPALQKYLFASAIEGACESVDREAIFAVDGAGPDVALSDGEVATLASTITVRLVEVP